jgi:hypothetical protein
MRAKARVVCRARFRPVTCRALCWIGAASGRRKSEEPPLLLPDPPGKNVGGLVEARNDHGEAVKRKNMFIA